MSVDDAIQAAVAAAVAETTSLIKFRSCAENSKEAVSKVRKKRHIERSEISQPLSVRFFAIAQNDDIFGFGTFETASSFISGIKVSQKLLRQRNTVNLQLFIVRNSSCLVSDGLSQGKPKKLYNVFKYSMTALRSSVVSTSPKVCPWLP